MLILVVDDSKAMRTLMTQGLVTLGVEEAAIVEASNGTDARTIIENDKPDLVYCDWNMPDIQGIDLLRELRASGLNLPFGFVTSEIATSSRWAADEAGAAFFITKPFAAADLDVGLKKANIHVSPKAARVAKSASDPASAAAPQAATPNAADMPNGEPAAE